MDAMDFLKASLSSPEQQSLCAESTRQAAAIIKAARDQPRSGKMRLKAVADARRRKSVLWKSVLQWHRKKAGLRAGGQRGRGADSAAGAVPDRHVPAGPSPFHHSSVQRPGAKRGAPMDGPGVQYEPQGPLPGGAVPMASGGPTAQDAIAYLCQVKMKFERQPQIYNKVCACAAHRWRVRRTPEPHVAPGAIMMDTLVRASRTRTRRHTDEISRARASCGSSSTS